MAADPKPPPRIVDREARKRKIARDPWCRACGRITGQCHHLIGKGQGGDDDEDNLVPLCGSGSSGCHGALHGNPYVTPGGRRWEAQDVRLAIGLSLTPSEYTYVLAKLAIPTGPEMVPLDYEPGREFLREHYRVEARWVYPLTLAEWSPF